MTDPHQHSGKIMRIGDQYIRECDCGAVSVDGRKWRKPKRQKKQKPVDDGAQGELF